jgi:hypothetical protein
MICCGQLEDRPSILCNTKQLRRKEKNDVAYSWPIVMNTKVWCFNNTFQQLMWYYLRSLFEIDTNCSIRRGKSVNFAGKLSLNDCRGIRFFRIQVADSGHRMPWDPTGKIRESHWILQENTGINQNRQFPGPFVRPGESRWWLLNLNL